MDDGAQVVQDVDLAHPWPDSWTEPRPELTEHEHRAHFAGSNIEVGKVATCRDCGLAIVKRWVLR